MQQLLVIRDRWFRFIKKYIIVILVFVAALIGFILMMAVFNGNEVTLKQEEFLHEVNTELEETASIYLEHVDEQHAEIDFSKVNTHELGQYQGLIMYEEKIYPISFIVQDTIPPVLESNKTTYVFSLDESLEMVNNELNQNIMITDNYDTGFAPLEIVTELPGEEKELMITLSVMDTSDNMSNVIVVSIQFTDTGEFSDHVPKEEITKNIKLIRSADDAGQISSDKEENTGIENSTSSFNTGSEEQTISSPFEQQREPSDHSNVPDNSHSANHTPSREPSYSEQGNQNSSVNAPPQEPVPEPDPVPEQTPNYTVPDGALDGGLFQTSAEGENWAFSFTDDPNSEWFHHQIHGDELSNGQWHYYILPY